MPGLLGLSVEQHGPVLRRRRDLPLLPPAPAWDQRTITLIGDRAQVERICAEWRREGWQVLTVDKAEPTLAGHPTHVVRVAVPPSGWRTDEQLLADLDLEG
jgi:hypothetical protein